MGWEEYNASPNAYCFNETAATTLTKANDTLDFIEIQSIISFLHNNPQYIDLLKTVMKIKLDDVPFVQTMLDRFNKE